MSRNRASILYQSAAWRLGRASIRALPPRLAIRLGQRLALLYAKLAPARRNVVVENLLPLHGGNHAQALSASRRLFASFAEKLVDLWRFESGEPVIPWFAELTGFEHMEQARQTGRGTLYVTPHLGNWELGAPLLRDRGVELLVVTQAEPAAGLTELRLASRAQLGIATAVIGADPFSFVDVIRRLDEGSSVALLVDRPRPGTGSPVNLAGRRLLASLAPSALARATGCEILPVCLPKIGASYAARVLPAIGYDRADLRRPQAASELSQRLMDAFAPAILRHAEQWYHFVPIWEP